MVLRIGNTKNWEAFLFFFCVIFEKFHSIIYSIYIVLGIYVVIDKIC